jgi:hypothetical protein
VASLKALEALLSKNYVRVVALRHDLQRVPFYSRTDFLYYNCITDLILSLKLIKES